MNTFVSKLCQRCERSKHDRIISFVLVSVMEFNGWMAKCKKSELASGENVTCENRGEIESSLLSASGRMSTLL